MRVYCMWQHLLYGPGLVPPLHHRHPPTPTTAGMRRFPCQALHHLLHPSHVKHQVSYGLPCCSLVLRCCFTARVADPAVVTLQHYSYKFPRARVWLFTSKPVAQPSAVCGVICTLRIMQMQGGAAVGLGCLRPTRTRTTAWCQMLPYG